MKSRLICHFCLCFLILCFSSTLAFAAELDPGFGNDGRVAVELGAYGDRANAVVVQPDGKIIVAGSSSSTADLDFLLFRLLADGSLDPSFNYDGTVVSPAGSADDEILAVALQDDGKIIVAGYSNNGSDHDFALARYNSDGSLDHDFGLQGIVVTSVGNSDDEITDIVLQDDGSIIVTGTALGTAGRVLVLGKYTAQGALDESFADQGFSFTGVGEEAQAESVAILNKKIVVAGSYSENGKTGLMVVGFGSDGQLDESFGNHGVAVPADGSVSSEGYGMFIRKNGAILVAGSTGIEGKRDAAIFQFLSDGSPDTSFEDSGVLVTAVSAEDDVLYDVLVTGNIIASTGFTTIGQSKEFLYITYGNASLNVQHSPVTQSVTNNALIHIADLKVEDSFETYTADQTTDTLEVEVQTTTFSNDEDVATALAEVPSSGVVVAGVSYLGETTSAAVSKYVPASTSVASTASGSVSLAIVTGEAFDVTRTTALIPVEIASSLSGITQRGIVFSTLPDPVLKEGSGGSTAVPVLSGLSPSGTVGITSVTLIVTTDVSADCKYTTTGSSTDYDTMENTFSSTGTTSHSQAVDNLEDGKSYSYYVRCKNSSSGEVNSTSSVISFTVSTSGTTDAGSGLDTTAPVITSTTQDSFSAGSPVVLSVVTDEDATCKYDTDSTTTFAEGMTLFTVTGQQLHTEDLGSNLAAYSHIYYVHCQDSTGNEATLGTPVTFTVSEAVLVMTNETDISFVEGQPATLVITTNRNATCRYSSDVDKSYDLMVEFAKTGTTLHTQDFGTNFAIDKYTYYTRCQDGFQNETDESTKIQFEVTAVASLLDKTLQGVGDFFVSPARAADTTDGETGDTNGDTTTEENNPFDPNNDDFLEEGNTKDGSGSGKFTSRLENLKPGTFFYARAYAVVNGATVYGNQVGFRTGDSCFVATAAFGSVFHPYVKVLRDFRDAYLMHNPLGRYLVNLYYHYSPPIADVIAGNSQLRLAVSFLLLPVVGAAWLAMQFGLLGLGVFLMASLLVRFCIRSGSGYRCT